MSKLHELLAVEKTRIAQASKLLLDATTKFKNGNYFTGFVKKLEMINDSPENEKLSAAAREEKAMPTTVCDTLQYVMDAWAKAEDVTYQKNNTNRNAVADIIFRENTIASDVSVDELLGLETRLETLRTTFDMIPTLDASRCWVLDANKGANIYRGESVEITTKTEKIMTPVILYDATDKHPAQIEKVTIDKVVGNFAKTNWSGAATTVGKAEALSVIDDLIAAVKQARMRANCTEVVDAKIGNIFVSLIMAPLKN
jgi:hypothetical protein